MPILKGFTRAIMDRYKAATSLVTSIGPIYANQLPDKVSKPYTSFTWLGGLEPMVGFSGGHRIEQPFVQFSVFCIATTPATIADYGQLLIERFDRCTLTFNETNCGSYVSIECRRVTAGEILKEPEETWSSGAWMFTADYLLSYWVA